MFLLDTHNGDPPESRNALRPRGQVVEKWRRPVLLPEVLYLPDRVGGALKKLLERRGRRLLAPRRHFQEFLLQPGQ